jgi:serine protease Do
MTLKSVAKTVSAAAIGGMISLGAYKTLTPEQTATIKKAAPKIEYGKLTSGYSAPAADPSALDFSAAAEKVTPAVVHIKSTYKSQSQARIQELPAPFREFFGDIDPFGGGFRQGAPHPQQASGSGVIISNDGYIVTNNHVIEKADEIEVSLDDKRSFKAKVIGTDPSTDLALIKVDAKDLPKLALSNSDDIKVGQWVIAVGNPFNLESTVTAGIISAKGRSINILKGDAPIESFIQTDAAVNPGNSGGALVNINGELIGINTAIASPTGAYAGYSFAVPSNIVGKVVEDLVKYGKVQRAFLGIQIRDLNSQLANEHNLKITRGVYVDSLVEDGAAKAGGMKKGDVITKVEDRTINSVAELQETIARHRPGEEVTVVVNRGGSEKTLHVPLRNNAGKVELVKEEKREVLKSLGAEFESVTEKDSKKLSVSKGVKISRIYPGKLRAQTDIKPGFVITRVNKQKVETVDELVKVLEKEKGGIMLEGVYPGSPDVYYYAFGL